MGCSFLCYYNADFVCQGVSVLVVGLVLKLLSIHPRNKLNELVILLVDEARNELNIVGSLPAN